jgi:hypothetical protein
MLSARPSRATRSTAARRQPGTCVGDVAGLREGPNRATKPAARRRSGAGTSSAKGGWSLCGDMSAVTCRTPPARPEGHPRARRWRRPPRTRRAAPTTVALGGAGLEPDQRHRVQRQPTERRRQRARSPAPPPPATAWRRPWPARTGRRRRAPRASASCAGRSRAAPRTARAPASPHANRAPCAAARSRPTSARRRGRSRRAPRRGCGR